MIDERLNNVEKEKTEALNQSNNLYSGLIQNNKDLYNQQLESLNKQETINNETLDKQLAFQKSEIEKQKETAKQNYETESRKALNDYTAFNNPYGYQAESRAQNGLLNSGISETAKLGSFNVYQNRQAMANKVMQNAFTQYDSEMNEAILNNDVQKAQYALEKLKLQQEYLKSYYDTDSTLKQNQYTNNQNIDNNYFNRYQTVYGNIQDEKDRAEAIRQWEEELQFKKKQAAQSQANWEKEYELSKAASTRSSSGGSGGYSYSLSNGSSLSNSSGSSSTPGAATGSIIGNMIKSVPDSLGNDASTRSKSDYYFSNPNGADYQPRYVNNTKLSKTGKTLSSLESKAKMSFNLGISTSKNIWQAGNKYYVWSNDHYVDVTDYYNKYK